MLDINKELENFNLLIKNIESKKFDDFYDLECEYCKIINLGNSIRNYIIQNPSLCSNNQLRFLQIRQMIYLYWKTNTNLC